MTNGFLFEREQITRWAISSPELEGLYTQCRQLSQVEKTAREAASLLVDVPEQDIAIKVNIEEPENVRPLIENLREINQQVEVFENKKRVSQQETVAGLIEMGFSYRDIATLVGVSYQRVGTIVKALRAAT